MSRRRPPVRRSKPIRGLLAPTLLALAPAAARAADRIWVNPTGGDYDNVFNWDGAPFGGVPNATDNVIFNQPTTYTVNFPLTHPQGTNAAGIFRAGAVTFNSSFGATYRFNNGLVIGQSAGQDAAVSNSHLLTLDTTTVVLGDAAGSTGRLTTHGNFFCTQLTVGNFGTGYFDSGAAFSTFTPLAIFGAQPGSSGFGQVSLEFFATDLRLGAGGSGTLEIANGFVRNTFATVGGTTGTGRASVTGLTAWWDVLDTLTIGGTPAAGRVDVANGGGVEVHNALFVRASGELNLHPSSRAVVGNSLIVAGGRVRATNTSNVLVVGRDFSPTAPAIPASLVVGSDLDASLSISAGGRVETANSAFVGFRPGVNGVVSIQGTGSRWSNPGFELSLGFSGRATLTVGNGALLTTGAGLIAATPGSSAVATVSDASWVNSSVLIVGREGNGRLTVTNGGSVENTAGAIALNPGAIGVVSVGGAAPAGFPAQWFNSLQLDVGNDSYSGSAVLQVYADGRVDAGGPARVHRTGSILVAGGTLTAPSLNMTGGEFNRTSGVVLLNSPADLSGLPPAGFYVGSSGIATVDASAGATLANGGAAFVAHGPGSVGIVTVRNPLTTFSNTSFLSVGEAGNGSLNVLDGAVVSAPAVYIGYTNTATGAVYLAGAGAALTTNFLSLGTFGGTARLTVDLGADARVSGIANLNRNALLQTFPGAKFRAHELTVDGGAVQHRGGVLALSSTDNFAADGVHLGLAGATGSLVARNGAFLSIEGFTRIASQPGSTAAASLEGLGTRWTNGDLDVGSSGSGSLLVSDRAQLETVDAYVGFANIAAGNATVRDQATWQAHNLFVGYSGFGRLTVSNGAQLTTLSAAIGVNASGDGRATIGGAGARWTNAALLDVGGSMGAASGLSITPGGGLDTGALRIAPGVAVTNTGGTVTAGTILNAGGAFNQSAGTLVAGAVTNNGTLSLAGKAVTAGVSGTGSVFLAGTLTADHLRQATLLADQPTSYLVLRPNGGPAGASRLTALNLGSNPFTSGPQGHVDLANNALVLDYAPADPDPVATIRNWIHAGRNAGAWDGPGIQSGAAAANPEDLAVGYASATETLGPAGGTFLGQAADATALLVRTTLLGDATLDGVVDFNDLVKLAQNYNTSLAFSTPYWWSHGDFTYDGAVDFNDLVKLAQHYNTALPAAGAIPRATALFEHDLARAVATVPEPSTTAFSVLGACGLGARRRRRARTHNPHHPPNLAPPTPLPSSREPVALNPATRRIKSAR